MFRVLIRTPARSFRILRTEPISRSISTSTVSRFPPSIKMADSAQSTPVESLASTPAPSDTSNANVPAQQNNKKQNHKKQNKPPHPNAANAKPKPVKKEVRILMLHGTLTTFPGCTDSSFNCPSLHRARPRAHFTELAHLTHRAHLETIPHHPLSPPP